MIREREGLLLSTRYFLDMYGAPILSKPMFVLADMNLKANIVKRDPREERTINIERIRTSDLPSPNKATRSFLEKSKFMKILLKIIGVLGVSLVMSGECPENMIVLNSHRSKFRRRSYTSSIHPRRYPGPQSG